MSESLLRVGIRSANRDDDEVRYGDGVAGESGRPALKVDNHEIGLTGRLIDSANDDVVIVVGSWCRGDDFERRRNAGSLAQSTMPPFWSASMTMTEAPRSARTVARIVAVVVFPTPPLGDVTEMMDMA
jgi:hypothetical protein